CSCRVSSCINLPFHRHCEHKTTRDREQIPSCKEREIAETKRSVRIMARLQSEGWCNCRAVPFRGLIGAGIDWLRHARAWSFEHAREIQSGAARVARSDGFPAVIRKLSLPTFEFKLQHE